MREFWDFITSVKRWNEIATGWAIVGGSVLPALALAGRTSFQSAQKRKNRGRELVEKAYPELSQSAGISE